MLVNSASLFIGLPVYLIVNQKLENVASQQDIEVNKMVSEVEMIARL